ncbi:MAG: hypothetical protein AAFO98_09900, partial [Pseudomonadota bacterium]
QRIPGGHLSTTRSPLNLGARLRSPRTPRAGKSFYQSITPAGLKCMERGDGLETGFALGRLD